MSTKSIILFCLAILVFPNLKAQETTVVVSDFEFWSNAGISKKLGDHWKFGLDNEFRWNKNATHFDLYLSELNIEYKITKFLDIGVEYRFYQNKNSHDIFETEHRISSYILLDKDFKRLELSYRLQIQNKDEDFFISSNYNNYNNIRNRIQLSYDIKDVKLTPYTSMELFRRFGSTEDAYFNKFRFTIGADYKLKKIGKLELFYRIDQDLHLSYTPTTYILGIGFTYKL